jgi:Sulfotransferase family
MASLNFRPNKAVLDGNAYFAIELKDWDVSGEYDNSLGLFGWCVSSDIRVAAIELYIGGCLLTSVPLRIPRAAVRERFPQFAVPENCGFHCRISKYIIPSDGTIDVSLFGSNDSGHNVRVSLGTVEFVDITRPQLLYREQTRPLILTGLGRSGTSMVMNFLSFHAGIVVPGPPPHELRTATWLWQTAQVLSAPCNSESVGPDSFEASSPHVLGYNPYRLRQWERMGGGGGALEWQERVLPNKMIDHVKQLTDEMVAAMRPNERVLDLYIAQKMSLSPLIFFVSNIYPSTRIILLVRDFRDAWLSARAFNEKRGSQSFGREYYNDDLSWFRGLSFTANQLKVFHLKFGSNIFLLKYEDILRQRKETLQKLVAWLGLDAGDAKMEEFLNRSASATREFGVHHQTAAPSATSRWKTEFTEEERTISDELYADALAYFVYDKA